MTRAKKAKEARSRNVPTRQREATVRRGRVALAAFGVAALTVVAAFWLSSSTGGEEDVFSGVPAVDPGPVHVHGLGVNPADGALFVATHTGLYKVKRDTERAERVADRFQDTMGFTIIGPNRFLGSGHPDLNEARERGLPPLLGLIESTDAGATWEPISLLGEADFHVLRSTGDRVYGYDASNDRLLASADRGVSWHELGKPGGPLVDLAVDPANPSRLVATSAGGLEQGLYESRDAGESWARLTAAVGLLAWPSPNRLYLVDGRGLVFASPDGGRGLVAHGEIGGEPAALLAQETKELYVALHDGTIKHSTDGGAAWTVRSRP